MRRAITKTMAGSRNPAAETIHTCVSEATDDAVGGAAANTGPPDRILAGSSLTSATGEPSSRGPISLGEAVTNEARCRCRRRPAPTLLVGQPPQRRHGVFTIESPAAGPAE